MARCTSRSRGLCGASKRGARFLGGGGRTASNDACMRSDSLPSGDMAFSAASLEAICWRKVIGNCNLRKPREYLDIKRNARLQLRHGKNRAERISRSEEHTSALQS